MKYAVREPSGAFLGWFLAYEPPPSDKYNNGAIVYVPKDGGMVVRISDREVFLELVGDAQ